jgi:hypothetical protein
MKVSDVLKQSKELILPRSGWLQGVNHYDNKYCAVGALQQKSFVEYDEYEDKWYVDEKTYSTSVYSMAHYHLMTAAKKVINYERKMLEDGVRVYANDIVEVNDRLGHEAVIKMYDLAIEEAIKAETPDSAPAEEQGGEKDAGEEVPGEASPKEFPEHEPTDEPNNDDAFEFEEEENKEEALALV